MRNSRVNPDSEPVRRVRVGQHLDRREGWPLHRRCGGLSSALEVARCGRSAGCVLCVLWAVSAVVLGGGGTLWGKHIIIDIATTNIV